MPGTIHIRLVAYRALLASLLVLSSVVLSHYAEAAAKGVRSLSSVCGWEQVDWSAMSGREQQLWSTLGWSEVKWDADSAKSAPASESKDWDELSPAEKNAAAQLGYGQKSWEIACK